MHVKLILQGISFLVLVFGIFMSLMFKIIGSGFSQWYLFQGKDDVPTPLPKDL